MAAMSECRRRSELHTRTDVGRAFMAHAPCGTLSGRFFAKRRAFLVFQAYTLPIHKVHVHPLVGNAYLRLPIVT